MIAASIIKKFFRDLKVPLINDELLNLFEKCEQISDKDVDLKIETIKKTLKKLPSANRDTFSFLIVHLSKVMQAVSFNLYFLCGSPFFLPKLKKFFFPKMHQID